MIEPDGSIIGTVAGLLGVLTGSTALISFAKRQSKDRAAEIEAHKALAEAEGRRKEREANIKLQVDSAHDKIRELDARQDQQEQDVVSMKRDLHNLTETMGRVDGKLDRLIERGHERIGDR